jgi:hypothetical protein
LAWVTVIVLDVPVMELVRVSVAAIVWPPAVFSVAENVPAPFVSVEFAGRTAEPSLLVKRTVPEYPAAVLLVASSAATVKLIAAPTVAEAGAETVKCVAAAAPTARVLGTPAEILTGLLLRNPLAPVMVTE